MFCALVVTSRKQLFPLGANSLNSIEWAMGIWNCLIYFLVQYSFLYLQLEERAKYLFVQSFYSRYIDLLIGQYYAAEIIYLSLNVGDAFHSHN